MLQGSYQVILGMGGFFLLLGIIFILGNKREKKKYYNSILLTQRDIKETITHEHERFWLHAWKICLLYTSPSPRDRTRSRMPSSA